MIQFIDNLVEKALGRKVSKGLLQFFRYLLCGAAATATDVTILFALTHWLHVNYLVSAACAFVSGVTVNYSLNIRLVFKSSGEIKKELPIFVLIGLGGLLWTELILWFLVSKLHVYVMLAKVVSIVLVLNWNFFMRKRFVFSEDLAEGEAVKNIEPH